MNIRGHHIPPIAPALVTGQPPAPRPADTAWTFGGIARAALREACPGGDTTEARLTLIAKDGVPT